MGITTWVSGYSNSMHSFFYSSGYLKPTIIFKSVGTLEEISHFLQRNHSPAPPSQCCDPPSITCYASGCSGWETNIDWGGGEGKYAFYRCDPLWENIR